MTPRRGSVVRAWLVAYDARAVALALGAIVLAGGLHASSTVPSVHGGFLPVWLLTPPVLALFAGLGAVSAIPPLGDDRRLVRARLLWTLTMCLIAGVAGEVVGHGAGQARLGVSTVLLTGLVFGASAVLGRLAPVVAAVPIIILLVNVHAARDVTPAQIWESMAPTTQLVVWGGWWLALLAHAWSGGRAAGD